MFKKDLPPIALLAKKILEEKENQTASLSLIRFNEKAKKKKINDTLEAFTDNILPPADGCHPSITIGTQSNKFKKFDSFKALQRDTCTGNTTDGEMTMPTFDDEQEDDNDDDNPAPFGMKVDDDGTRHYTTADGKKDISFKKNAPQNGEHY